MERSIVIAAFKLKYPKVNFSKDRLNAIADKVIKKVIDDETKIDATLTELDEAIDFVQTAKTDDKHRDTVAKLKEIEEGKKPAAKVEDVPIIDDDTPAWAKALIESNKTMSATVQALQADKAQGTIKYKLTEALKGVPEVLWNKRALPGTDEEIEAFVEDVKADVTSLNIQTTNTHLTAGAGKGAGGATGGAAAATNKVDPSLTAFVEKNKQAASKTVATTT